MRFRTEKERMTDTSVFHGKTAKYMTLGCKLNFSETATFARTLYNMGVGEANAGEAADICLINTCSVTEMADHKCRQQIHKMVRENPGAVVVVTGCYAQLKSEEIAQIPGVSLVLGSNEKAHLVEYLRQAMQAREADPIAFATSCEGHPAFHHAEKTKDIHSFQLSCSRGNRTRYFLKVQDGCNYFCTYCTIPYARGFSRNPSIATLVEQVKQAAAEGGKEVVITGVNIGDFGRTTGERFIDLVKALDEIEDIRRYRISSLEPDLCSDELIDYCAHSRAFMPHFHIPLQSGSDTVLRLMHRRYDAALFAHKVELIKEKMPHAFIGVDVMVGCGGAEVIDRAHDINELSYPLPGETIARICKHMADLPATPVCPRDGVFYVPESNACVEHLSRVDGVPYQVVDFAEFLREPQPKVMFTMAPEVMPRVIERASTFADDTVKAAALQTTQRLYEFMDPRVSKTRGLVRVAELNDMELQNICVFGDADNDTCMVADAGVGVAMANGSDATRAAADFVTASNDEDGIAIFIEEHLL